MSDVWRLDLAALCWEPMPGLPTAVQSHACCAVRGALVVLGGRNQGNPTSSVELLSKGEDAFVALPPLSCGALYNAAAFAVDESNSALGQVLLLGGTVVNASGMTNTPPSSSMQILDLATGVCTPQPHLRNAEYPFAAATLPDGRVVCAGGIDPQFVDWTAARVYGPPEQGVTEFTETVWTWRAMPSLNAARSMCCGCVMSDGRFAVLGGMSDGAMSSCEALSMAGGDGGHWDALPPMHEPRTSFACAAVAGCIIVAGGLCRNCAEIYDEALGRWFRLPCKLPHDDWLGAVGYSLI